MAALRRLELGWSRELVAERLGVVNKILCGISSGGTGMSVETLINLSRLYGVSLDTLIMARKRKKSAVSQEEQLDARTQRDASRVYRDYCLRMLWLFADGLRAHRRKLHQNAETVPETVKSSSDSKKTPEVGLRDAGEEKIST